MSTSTDMKVRALAPWFGGKRTMAPDIVRELGPHTQFFDFFCGSMSILFAKEPSQKETVNDLHGDLVNLARIVSSPDLGPKLYDRAARTIMGDPLLEDARHHLEAGEPPEGREVDLERAYWYFIASWMGRNGTAGTARHDYQLAVRWTNSGGSPTVRWANAVQSIPAWHRRLQRVVIMRRDALELVGRVEDAGGSAIYIDPPYPAETRAAGGCIGSATSRYMHEFDHQGGGLFGAADEHERLAVALRGYQQARVVVSTYDCERYRELYDGWTFIDHARQKHLHCQNGRGARPKEAPEVLIVNGPSFNPEHGGTNP